VFYIPRDIVKMIQSPSTLSFGMSIKSISPAAV